MASCVTVGARVSSRSLDQHGVVVGLHGDMASIRTPSGLRTVPINTLKVETDDPLEMLAMGEFDEDPEWFEVRLRAARLEAAYGSDEMSGLANSRVILRPHQIFVAHRVLDKPRPSMILADEVGLGKTVEAGLVIKELLARRAVDTVLIVTPPNLLNQWQTELRIKFNERFEIVDRARLGQVRRLHPERNPWSRLPKALVSSYLVRDEEVREEIKGIDWGLVVLDEAHHCRRKRDGSGITTTQLYRTFDELKDGAFGLLLLTATPMQLDPYELYSLVDLVEPGLFQSQEDFFEDAFASAEARGAVKSLQGWSDLTAQDRRELEWLLAKRDIQGSLASPTEREDMVDGLLATVRVTDAIVRNRKRTVGGFTRRIAQTNVVDLTPEETEIHGRLDDYLRRGFEAARAHHDRLLSLEMVTFHRLLTSSSAALASALANRRRRLLREAADMAELSDDPDESQETSMTLVMPGLMQEVEVLDSLIGDLQGVNDSKVQKLVELVRALLQRDPNEKILIFTQFLATQRLIADRLSDFRVVRFNGGMSRVEKDVAVARFRTEAQVMISTESGGEGRNFQFCHILINHDLHWNPMRIEQRIGRLDRYGQKYNVQIYNLVQRGTIEDRLLELFIRRLDLFEVSVGALELVLGEFENDLKGALVNASGDISQAVQRFERDLELRIRDSARVEAKSADFLIEVRSFRPDEADALTLNLQQERVRIDLERLVIHLLALFPTAHFEVEGDDQEVYRITVPPALPRAAGVRLEQEYVGSFSAARAVQDESLDFFGFGHPLVDAGLKYATGQLAAGRTACRALPAQVRSGPAVELHYVVELEGIRKWKREVGLVFTLDGQRLPEAEAELAFAEAASPPVELPPVERLEHVRDVSIEAMATYISRERDQFDQLNQRWVAEERRRVRRIHSYNVRRIEDRVDALRLQIMRLDTENDPDRARIIPALRGQINRLERELETLEGELSGRLQEIEARASVGESLNLVSAALLMPECSCPNADARKTRESGTSAQERVKLGPREP